MQLYLNQQGSLSVPRQLYWFRHRYVFSLKICQKILRSREALHNRYQLNLKKGGFFKLHVHTCVQAAPYLQAHGGWDQQSLDRPPTRRAKVPAGPAADCAATRLAHPPSGSGWSCTGWGPLLSPGTALAQRWDPATQTSSIWSPSDQPGTQEKSKVGKDH